MFTLAPFSADVPETASDISVDVAPTAPPKLPLAVTARACAPSIVAPKATVVPCSVASAPSVTAPEYACAPDVVIVPPCSAPAPETDNIVSAAVPPTAPPKLPPPAMARPKAPFSVEPKPTVLPVSVLTAPSVTAPVYV